MKNSLPQHSTSPLGPSSLGLLGALIVGVVALLSGACNNASQDTAPAAGSAAGTATSAPPNTSAPVDSGGSQVQAAGLAFTLPTAWTRQQPSSSMRAVEAEIPGSAGSGQLAVFFFGPGGGGSVDANLDRWTAQMAEPKSAPVREQFESGDYLVTTIQQTGTLVASTMGTFPTTDQPGYGLLGAVVEGPGGPWFFKAVGPQATLAEQQTAFRAMLENLSAS